MKKASLIWSMLIVLLATGCEPQNIPVAVDQRITYMLTGEDPWPDIKISYYAVEGDTLCYEVTHDGEVWYGIASLIEGEWFVNKLLVGLCSKCG